MRGTSDIPHTERWPLSHREREMHAGKNAPCQRKKASIPDNWLCISDWQITHQLVFGQGGKRGREKRREACGRFTHSIPLGKIQSTMTPCSMSEKASVYTETKTDSHTTVHTKTHTPTFMEAAHRALLCLTPALLTSVSQGQSEYSVTCSCQNASIFS